MATVEIHGLERMMRHLDAVPRKLQRKILRRGLRKGAALVRDEARRRVRRRSGLLAKSITVASSRGSGQRGAVAYKVGLRSRAWYGRYLEYGHVKRGRGEKIAGGERRRAATREVLKGAGQFVPPYPFMRPAADKLPRALDAVADEVRGALLSGELSS
ncbi:HK97-gp10 family putative phage morphogenesis protein [Chromobacterium violaceum]|uniref:HK97-gp10 family putative phage morphogenesis protein n=1 Tax=Chromobacterium violaceum TaxID=536 RepID=UPI00385B7C25